MSRSRPVAPEQQTDDAGEASFRPLSLEEFVGQRGVRENLRVFIDAARGRGEALDHVLSSARPA